MVKKVKPWLLKENDRAAIDSFTRELNSSKQTRYVWVIKDFKDRYVDCFLTKEESEDFCKLNAFNKCYDAPFHVDVKEFPNG